MIKIIYDIDQSDMESEKAWLNSMKVYPSFSIMYDWIKGKNVMKVGAIVSNDAATAIKLRHPLQFQQQYSGR